MIPEGVAGVITAMGDSQPTITANTAEHQSVGGFVSGQ